MAQKNLKSTVALVVAAFFACVFNSCSEDNSVLGLDLDNNGNTSAVTYMVKDTYHVEMQGCSLVEDSIEITGKHRAVFVSSEDETIEKDYQVINPAHLSSTEVYVNDLADIIGKSFDWTNGRIQVGKSVLALTFGQTRTSNVTLGGKTYTKNNGLGYCTVKSTKLLVSDMVNQTEAEKFSVQATLVFTMSCDETVEYPVTLLTTVSHKEVLTYTYDDAVVISATEAKVVRHDFVDGVEKGTTDIIVPIETALRAEAKKTTANLTEIKFNTVRETATTGVYRASWNVVSHELYATYPATVTFVDNNEEHTVALKAVWSVKFDSKETIDKSSETDYIYNTTAKFNLVADSRIIMASATQEIEQKDAKNTQKITATIVGEDENGVKIRLFIDNSKEQDVEKFFFAPSGLSVKAEAEKRIKTSPITLSQSGHNAGNWIKGATKATSDNVKYTTYSRVDSYVYNDGKVSTSVTYTKNDNYIVVWEGKEYKASGLGSAVITAGTPAEISDNSDNSSISKTFRVDHSISRGNVSKTAEQLITLWKERTPSTIPGYYVKAAAMTDIYNASRTAPARTVICAFFQEINGSNTLYVEFNSKGEEISRHANVNVTNDGIMSMVWNGASFVPGKLTGVNTTSEDPNEWLYTAYNNSSVQSYVSPMSVTKHSLENPYKAEGVKTTVDGEEVIVINGVTLK